MSELTPGNPDLNNGYVYTEEDPFIHRRKLHLKSTALVVSDEERDLRMAIELSLRDTTSPDGKDPSVQPSTSGVNPAAPQGEIVNPFSEEYSTIVTRVPNKSVEDLAHEAAKAERNSSQETLGACGGHQDSANQERARSHDQSAGEGDGSNLDPDHVPNTFGLIKDISVNNICASDLDKMKDFDKKDFSQIYVKSQPIGEMEKVFEPRPSGPDQSLAKKLHLTPTNTATTSPVARRQEVWV